VRSTLGRQVCKAHQLRNCKYAIEAGDTIFAPQMKALLLRAVVSARRRRSVAASTRRSHLRRLDHAMIAIMVLAPANPHGKGLRKRYGKVRSHLFTFWSIPTLRRTTMVVRGNCDPQLPTVKFPAGSVPSGALICSLAFDPSWVPPLDGDGTHIKQFAQSRTANLSVRQVEQIRIHRVPTQELESFRLPDQTTERIAAGSRSMAFYVKTRRYSNGNPDW
jgi:hypothetical protein